MNTRRILVIVSLLLWTLVGATSALACDPLPRVVVIEDASASDKQKPRRIKRFGNKKRIAKLRAERPCDSARCVILVRDPLVRPDAECIKRAGNKNKIARRIDAAERDLSGRVVFIKDEVGRPDLVAMKRFGNKKRIAKRLDESAD